MDKDKWEEAYRETRRSSWLRKKRIKYLELNKRSKILDLGCGDGLNLQIFRNLGYTNLFATDYSFDLVSKIKDFRVCVTDCRRLGFKSNSFDVIFVDSVLHHIDTDELSLAYEEIKRILREGGNLCFFEPRDCLLRKLLDFLTLNYGACFGFLKNRKKSIEEEMYYYKKWLKSENLQTLLLEKLGLKVVKDMKLLIGRMVVCSKII